MPPGNLCLAARRMGIRGERKKGKIVKKLRTQPVPRGFGAEENGKDFKSRILFSSTAIRHNAGQSEQFLIRLTDEQLKRAGIPIPVANDPVVPQDLREQ